MNINTAIILGEAYLRDPLCNLNPSERQAFKLGMEALKERQEAIRQGLPLWHELLPGKTPTGPQGRRADELKKLKELRKVET